MKIIRRNKHYIAIKNFETLSLSAVGLIILYCNLVVTLKLLLISLDLVLVGQLNRSFGQMNKCHFLVYFQKLVIIGWSNSISNASCIGQINLISHVIPTVQRSLTWLINFKEII